MSIGEIVLMLTTFAGGVGMFLYGMHTMAAGLQKTSAGKMKQFLTVITKNKFFAVLVGIVVTVLVQSSSATTVMVVGFVNAGIMNLTQSVGVIMGANIGTTFTSWLVASVEWSQYFNLEKIAPVAMLFGAVMVVFFRKHKVTQIGEIIVGFGILFIGISTMSVAVKDLRDLPIIAELFTQFGTNPLLGVAVGALVTACIQSSLASISILQTLAALGIVPVSAAVYIIMGQNIGTCITAILSSIGTSTNAKRAAGIHLLFNMMGTLIFTVGVIIFFTFINREIGSEAVTMTQISFIHTLFNVGTTIIIYPFSGMLVTLSQRFIKEKKETKRKAARLDDRIMTTPAFAIENSFSEVIRLTELVRENLVASTRSLLERDTSGIAKILEREEEIDELEHAVTEYLVKLCNEELNDPESATVAAYLHCLTDIERVGDHSENIAEITQFITEKDIVFSDTALSELSRLVDICVACFDNCVKALGDHSTETFRLVEKGEDDTDILVKEMRSLHITRLASNECKPVNGVAYLDALTNMERITDHCLNIAESAMLKDTI